MREKLLFIYNPNAGKARLKSKLSDIVQVFSRAGYETIVMPTEKRGDATKYAREYAAEGNCSRIVCAGGDGTLSEVVSGVLQSGAAVPIGFIPSGTTNDFGYSLKIPKNFVDAAELAVTAVPVPSDSGEINGKTFVYTAAFGLFADVSYDTSQNAKNVLGRTAYILSGASKLHNIKSYHLSIEYSTIGGEAPKKEAGEKIESKKQEGENLGSKDQEIEKEGGSDQENIEQKQEEQGSTLQEERVYREEGEFIYGMISNSDSVGGFKGLAGKGVQFDDGVFEMLLVRKPHNPIELTDIVNKLLSKKLNGEHIVYAQVKNVQLFSEDELPWSLDGEFGGDMPQARIHIRKQSVRYLKAP